MQLDFFKSSKTLETVNLNKTQGEKKTVGNIFNLGLVAVVSGKCIKLQCLCSWQ